MLHVYSCITEQHDIGLVVVAALICGLACYTTFNLLGRAVSAAGGARSSWTCAAALALGCGVWATHFIAMLAYQPHLPAGYDVGLTVLSILIAIFIAGVGLALALGPKPAQRVAGGVVIGACIGAMHYVGMAALELPARIEFDPGGVIASVLLGMVFAAAATSVALSRPGFRRSSAAAALLALGICSLHFTGMAAVRIVPDASIALSAQAVNPALLAVAVTSVTVLILALGLAGSIVDQHLEQRSAQEAQRLRNSEARLRQLADATFEGVLIQFHGRIVDANRASCQLVGLPLEQLIGRHVLDFVDAAHHGLVRERLANPGPDCVEIGIRHADGSAIPVEILAQDIDYRGNPARVVAVRDLRERKKAEERIRHMAHHDMLTGLPNRNLFHDRLRQAMALSQRSGATVAVLCLDLDRFKNVNDLLGHTGGDQLLKQVARRLSENVRGHDTVARLSGDEFAIVQTGESGAQEAAQLAERLVQVVAEPYDLAGQQMMIGTSIGIALYPGDGANSEELVRAADTALYRAKEAGRHTYRFFEAAMDVRLQERSRLERDLRLALATDQLELHYQPLLACDSVEVVGFEALVRWRHPERGEVSPAEFIPLAEDSGLILPLGSWVLRTACREAVNWPEHVQIAVNLSPAQFRHADLAREVLNVLRETGLAPDRLELEITEGVLIEDTERTLTTLQALKAAGVRISLDDFGTGYSSLSYLQRFPFDKLKIDRSFVWEMQRSVDSMAIVRAVIALGHSLRITVTAEGVETAEQLALLQGERCDQVQGFLLGRPAPAPAFAAEPAPAPAFAAEPAAADDSATDHAGRRRARSGENPAAS